MPNPNPTTAAHRPADVRLAEQVLGLMNRIGPVWQAAVRDTTGHSAVRMKVLGLLSRSGPTRAGELAVVCGITPSAMTEMIESLVEDKHARRDDDPTDRRAVLIAITPAGQAEVDRVVAVATAILLTSLERLSGEQRARLRAALTDLAEVLASTSKETRNVR
jgi:DNA-binding MarR family transcriptional regulator